MKWWKWTSAFAALSKFPLSSAQSTTISIGLSYCPPPATAALPQPTIGPFAPYYLFVAEGPGGPFRYINTKGYLVDITEAAQFIITDNGQLRVGNQYVSANKNTSAQSFGISPVLGSISTVFLSESGLLRWRNDAFAGLEASFCRTDNAITVVFNEILPSGCRPVLIGLILVARFFDSVASTSPLSYSGLSISTSQTVSGLTATPESSILTLTSASTSLSSLTSGIVITTSTSAETNIATITTSVSVSSTSSIPSPPSTSNSQGTSTTTSLSTASTSQSISSTTLTSTPSSQVVATSVSLVITSVDSTIAGSTSTSTPIQSSTGGSENSSTSITDIQSTSYTTTNDSSTTTTQVTAITSTTDSQITTATTESFVTTTVTSIATTTTASPSNIGDTATSTMMSSTIEDLTTRTIPPPSTDTTSSSSTTTTTTTSTTTTSPSCSILPLSSPICPVQDKTAIAFSEDDSPCYGILCSKSLIGTVLTGNSTVANSLRACAGYCSLYNTAIPYGCLGVNYLGATVPLGQNNCLLYTQIEEEDDAVGGVDSIRLIYPGYPSVQKRGLMVDGLDLFE